jgi:hypothetical protein
MMGSIICGIALAAFLYWLIPAFIREVFRDRQGLSEADARVLLYGDAHKRRVSR